MVIDGGSGGGPGRTGEGPRRGRPGRAPRIEQPQTVIRLPKDPYDGEFRAPRARRGRGVLALAGVVIVVAAVIAVNSSKHTNNNASGQGASTGVGGGVPPATATVGSSAPAGASPVFPSQTANGIPTGYQDTQSGAEAAATNYVASYVSEPMVHTNQRHAMIQAIADPTIVSHLQSELDTAFAAAARGYGLDANGNPPAGQTLVYRGVPAGVRVDSYTNTKAVVAVWTCTIDGIAGTGSTYPVSSTWSTLTITLTWVNNDWRWNDFAQADGPTPVGGTQQASTADALQKAAQQFARLRYAP